MENLIINHTDERFSKLSKIFEYNLESVRIEGGRNSTKYYIPPELVLDEYVTWKVNVVKCPKDNGYDNWITCRAFPRILNETTKLDIEEYYNLVIQHINDRSKRQKCTQCGGELYFTNLSCGYSHHNYALGDSQVFCSISCQVNWMNKHNVGMNSIESNIRKAKTQFLIKGSLDDEAYLYVTWTDDHKVKYGITTDIDSRYAIEYMNGYEYNQIHKLIVGTRNSIADLESRIKLYFSGREYLEKSELSKFFKILRSELTTQN